MKNLYRKNIALLIACCFMWVAAMANTPLTTHLLPNSTFKAQGATVKIDHVETFDTEGSSGTGEVFVPFLQQSLAVHFSGVAIDADGNLQRGTVHATIDKKWYNGLGLGNDILRPNFYALEGMKTFVKQAKNNKRLPMAINKMAAYEGMNFGTMSVILTELNINAFATEASVMATERMPEGLYIPFTAAKLSANMLTGVDFCSTQLTLKDDANVNDTQLPISFAAHDPNAKDAKGTFVQLDCSGFKFFSIEGYANLPADKVTPVSKSEKDVRASFRFESQSLRQFVTSVQVTPFAVVGSDDLTFNISEAYIDYSDSLAVPNFPKSYFEDDTDKATTDKNAVKATPAAGTTAANTPTNENTWKGFYLKSLKITLPVGLGIKNKDGAGAEVAMTDVIVDRGNGVSATLALPNTGFKCSSESGFSFSLDTLALKIRKSSFKYFTFGGALGIPIIQDEAGVLKYKATINMSADATIPKAEFVISFAKDAAFNVPFLNKTKLFIDATSRAGVVYKKGKMDMYAVINGKFQLDLPSVGLTYDLPFEDFAINRAAAPKAPTATPKTGGGNALKSPPNLAELEDLLAEEGGLNMDLKAVKTDGVDAPATEAKDEKKSKISGFEFELRKFDLGMKGDTAKLSLSVMIKLAKGVLTAQGGVTTYALIDKKKLLTIKPWQGITYDRTDLDTLIVEINKPKFYFRGSLIMMRNDPVYGNGFAADVELNVAEKIKGKARAMFGTMPAKGMEGEYRYFYVDAKLGLGPTGIPLGAVNIYALGGGAYMNMNTEMDTVKKTVRYVPKKGIFGFKALVDLGLPVKESLYAETELEVQFGEGFAFQKLQIVGRAYMLRAPGAALVDAAAKGSLVLTLDAEKKIFSAVLEIEFKKGDIISANGTATMMVDLQNPSNFSIKIGTPQTPFKARIGPLQATMYLMIGKDLPRAEPLSKVHAKLAKFDIENEKGGKPLPETGTAFAAGIQFRVDKQEFKYLMFVANFEMVLGADIRISQIDPNICPNVGLNNWMFEGRAYAYLNIGMAINVDALFYKGQVKILQLEIAAAISAKLPNPTMIKGGVSGEYSVLNGLVKGSFKFMLKYQSGTPCEGLENGTPDALKGIKLIADVLPKANEKDVPVFEDMVISSNVELNKVQVFKNDLGEDKFYKCVPSGVLTNRSTGQLVACKVEFDSKNPYLFKLVPSQPLAINSNHRFTAIVTAWYADINGKETARMGQPETRDIDFTTGGRPDRVYEGMVGYQSPAKGQLYWNKNYAEAKVELKTTGYEDLFTPNYAYEYKFYLSKKVGTERQFQGMYDLNAVPGDRFESAKYWGICTYWYVPYPCVKGEDVQSKTIKFSKLNELNLDKGATYVIEVVRQKKGYQRQQPKKSVVAVTTTDNTTTKTGNTPQPTTSSWGSISSLFSGFGSNSSSSSSTASTKPTTPNTSGVEEVKGEATETTTSRTLTRETKPQETANSDFKVLFETEFGVSQYNSIYDKIELATSSNSNSTRELGRTDGINSYSDYIGKQYTLDFNGASNEPLDDADRAYIKAYAQHGSITNNDAKQYSTWLFDKPLNHCNWGGWDDDSNEEWKIREFFRTSNGIFESNRSFWYDMYYLQNKQDVSKDEKSRFKAVYDSDWESVKDWGAFINLNSNKEAQYVFNLANIYEHASKEVSGMALRMSNAENSCTKYRSSIKDQRKKGCRNHLFNRWINGWAQNPYRWQDYPYKTFEVEVKLLRPATTLPVYYNSDSRSQSERSYAPAKTWWRSIYTYNTY